MKKFSINKILVPIDFSKTAANALRHAIHLARLTGARIKLVHVVTPIYATGSELTLPYSKTYFDRLYRAASVHLKRIIAENKRSNNIDITCDVKMGGVEKVVNYIAEKENFDLVMMGTHGTSGVKEFFIGSNAYKVVHNAVCPVITVQNSMKPGFKNIILPIRLGLHSRQKVNYVVELAKIYGSMIHVVGFTEHKDKTKRNRLRQYARQVEDYLSNLDLNYRSSIIFGDNFIKDILTYANENNADLVAVMNDNSFSLDQLLKGPFAKQLVNHSHIPVLSIPIYISEELSYTPYLSGQMPA